MKHFVYFSAHARTSGNFDSDRLMDAGRMDIAVHTIINAFFLSHDKREDVKIHLVFYGMPDPPKHIEITLKEGLDISKKDVGNLIKKILYKYREGKKTEVFPGCFIEKKSFLKVIAELIDEGKEIFVLDKEGEDIRKVKFSKGKELVFVIGDQDGFPRKELKRLKEIATPISVGPKMYFASHVVTIINNELDVRGI